MTTTAGGQVFGTGGHPFGSAVADPARALRLGALTTVAFDTETQLGFGFLLTNHHLYAWYERRPFARHRLGHYASFAYAIPLSHRTPTASHDLTIAYDRSSATVRWLVGNHERFRLNHPGELIDRRWMILDNGGTPEQVAPRQLNGGFGMLTLLDAASPGKPSLVRLSNLPHYYFDTGTGPPTPQQFLDNTSFTTNRLFGQGAELRIRRFDVQTHAVRR